jgi:hypothetical protein
MLSLVPLFETETIMPRPIAITTPINAHVVLVFVHRSLRILADEQTDQLARRRRHGAVRKIAGGHDLRHLLDGHVRSEGARSGAHGGSGSNVSVLAELVGGGAP